MAEIRNDEADIAFHALQAISGAFRGLELSGPLMADAQRIDLAFQDCIGAIAHSAFVGFPDDPRRWGAAETILNGDAFFDPATWEQTEQWRHTKLDVEGQVLDAASASDSAVEAALSSALARTVRQRVDQFAKRLPGDRLTTPVRKRLIYAMVHFSTQWFTAHGTHSGIGPLNGRGGLNRQTQPRDQSGQHQSAAACESYQNFQRRTAAAATGSAAQQNLDQHFDSMGSLRGVLYDQRCSDWLTSDSLRWDICGQYPDLKPDLIEILGRDTPQGGDQDIEIL
jgi:hypothetical protein